MSDFVLDASIAIQWLLVDEIDRQYSLRILAALNEQQASVPALWLYEVGNALVMACRRKRISADQMSVFLKRLGLLPIRLVQPTIGDMYDLPHLAQQHNLTNYDAAYLALALKFDLPLATTDKHLRDAAVASGARIMT